MNGHEGSTAKNLANLGEGRYSALNRHTVVVCCGSVRVPFATNTWTYEERVFRHFIDSYSLVFINYNLYALKQLTFI